MAYVLREMTMADYESVYAIWQASEGVGLSGADMPKRIADYLAHNPGTSFVAVDGARVVGAVLCGSDGRRGYLHHLAVLPAYRKSGVGRALVDRCMAGLREQGIEKCHIFVYDQNEAARQFWARIGWVERTELVLMSRDIEL